MLLLYHFSSIGVKQNPPVREGMRFLSGKHLILPHDVKRYTLQINKTHAILNLEL